MTAVFAALLLIVIAAVAATVRPPRTDGDYDLGSISERWLATHRAESRDLG